MKIDNLRAKEHINKWTNAWNDHDLMKVLSLYSDDILFSSPKVRFVFPDRQPAIQTRER